MRNEGDIGAVFTEWITAQRALLEEWGRTFDSGGTAESRQMIDEMMRAWRRSVDETLEMQRDWARAFAQEVEAMDGVPGDVAERVRKSTDEFVEWASAQREVWGSWFDMASDIVPEEARSAGEDLMKTAATAMQTGFSRLVEANRRIVERLDDAAKRAG
jgi:hypothetical protein